jgi:hypothetical protein
MSSPERDLDRLIWGARSIAAEAGLKDTRGRPRTRAAYHLLETKKLPATKVGKVWVSTPRRLRSVANGGAA